MHQASDCSDLLTKIQDDAIAKLKMTVALAKTRASTWADDATKNPDGPVTSPPGPALDAGLAFPGSANGGGSAPSPVAPPVTPGGARDEASSDSDGRGSQSSGPSSGPTGASDTNTQVADVDEADFVKVVDSGKGIFLLHGNTLRKLKSWPAAETALVGTPLKIEGTPSEMFVTESGKAVIFSAVHSYGTKPGAYPPGVPIATSPVAPDERLVGPAVDCAADYCGGYYGATKLKITVADVSGAAPVVERELYYEGSYLSSRRYASGTSDVVRTVVQASSKFSGLFEPQIRWYDAWGRPYDAANIASQLDEWEQRTTASIRKTTLDEWLPGAEEVKDGQRAPIARQCDAYYVPEAGLSDYGLTHVLSLDVAAPSKPVAGVTIVGAASTVYSNTQQLVLAQPDYRWSTQRDFGLADSQQTALHVFSLSGADTAYVASGWVPGHLPLRNAQFGLDVSADGTIRVATTGWVRDQPEAQRTEPAFWQQHTENYVLTARTSGTGLSVVGKSPALGHEGEQVYSARFVGDRAYVVTFRQTDPLIVVDLKNPAAPAVLGELEIPGFSEYMHPLDANHLITLGQSASRGIQLQLFDVTNPASLPPPKVLDFGSGTSSQGSYSHKALTFFEDKLAVPLSGYRFDLGRSYLSGLELVKVDAAQGFTHLGRVDHAPLYADNGAGIRCGVCDVNGCRDYACSYSPEVLRGHFIKGDTGTYVYSFSHAGVLVNDLANLAQPVARVGLPAPTFYDDGYPGSPVDAGAPSAGRDGGSSVPAQDAGPALPSDGGVAMPLP